MAHSTEKTPLLTLLDKLVNNPGDTEDEESSSASSDVEFAGNNSNGKNGTIVNHVTPEPENDSIQVLSTPPTVSQKRKRGPRPKSDVYYVPITVLLTLSQL
jgi:hypothetical protein